MASVVEQVVAKYQHQLNDALRWPAFGRSSRGFDVAHAYLQYARYRERGRWRAAGKNGSYEYPACRVSTENQYYNKATVRLVALPCEVAKECSRSGAAVLRGWFSEALRAGYAAGGVGSGSAALPPLPYEQNDQPPRARRKQRHDGGVMW